MRKFRLLAATLLVVACACSSNGSTGGSPSPSEPPTDASDFVNLLQVGVSYDYEPSSGPADEARAADLVVVGRIEDVVLGRTLPYGRANEQANLVIAVEQIMKGQAAKAIHVEVPVPAGVTVDALRKAAPSGRLLLFLDDRTDVSATGPERGRPAGTPVYTPFVEGMIIETPTGWTSGLVDRAELAEGWNSLAGLDEVITVSGETPR